MSNISHNIRKFNRFELKYLVPLKAAEKFKHDLRAYLVPDEHGDSNGSYDVSSLYFDGPDYRFYWEKVDGLRFRRKLRIRHYETDTPLAETTPVYLEIKQRLNKVTQKRRVKMSYRDAKLLCEQRIIPAHTLDDAPVIEEITSMLWQNDLRPASIIRYSRQAFIGSEYDVGLRVTFDRDLSYTSHPLTLQCCGIGLPLLPAEWSVIEIKVNERVPYWLTELVAMHDLSLVRVSKYCRSIDLIQNLPVTTTMMTPVYS